MTPRRPWAAVTLLLVGLTLAGASRASPWPRAGAAGDAGPARVEDAGRPASSGPGDGGTAAELDLEVVENLDLLQHLDEAQLLEFLLPVRDE